MYVRPNLFSQIEGKQGEPFATRILAWLLNLPRVQSAILQCIPDLPPLTLPLRVDCEKSVQDARPDIGLISEEAAIALEVKFWAGLTPAQQAGYISWFRGKSQPVTRLVLLVPESRRATIASELAPEIRIQEGTLWSHISWEYALSQITSANWPEATILDEFVNFIRRTLPMDAPITDAEFRLIQDKHFAATYLKLNSFHWKVSAPLQAKGYVLASATKSYENYWGSNIELPRFPDGWSGWFGMWADPWEKFGDSPYYLAVYYPKTFDPTIAQKRIGEAKPFMDGDQPALIFPVTVQGGTSLTTQAEAAADKIHTLLEKLREIATNQ